MSDQPPQPPSQPGQPWPPAAPSPAPPPPPAAPPTEAVPTTPPAGAGGANWQGVEPVVERPTEAVPPVPPAAPPPAPPVGGPAGGGGNGAKVAAIVVLVLAILGVGAFLLLSGDDEDDDGEVATEQDDETTTTEADEETTTTEADEETTTTEAPTTTTAAEGDGGELSFTEISDDSGTLVVEVPDSWTDVDGTALGDGAPNVQASSDLAAFRQLAASGISFTLLNQQDADPDATLDFLQAGQEEGCTVEERQDYTDGVFTGRLQELSDCGGQGITLIIIVASNEAGQSVEVSTVIVPPDPVEEIEQHIIETFNVR